MTTKLKYNGYEIAFADDDKKVNLTDMWKATGGERYQRPVEWLRRPQAVKFLESLKKDLNGVGKAPLETRRGLTGGTYAHWARPCGA